MKNIGRLVSLFLVGLLLLSIPTAFSLTSDIIHDYDGYGNKGNCVAFVRKLVPSFTGKATTIDQKKAIGNSDTASAGSVAIMTSSYTTEYEGKTVYTGHVGYVESVSGSQITIIDANFGSEDIRRRIGTASELNIVKYYDPNFSNSGSQSQSGTVTFYEHKDGGGWNYSCSPGKEVRDAGQMGFPNDQLSCVRVSGSNIKVEIFEHDNFNGRKLTFDREGLFNLDSYDFNDICSSYKVYYK